MRLEAKNMRECTMIRLAVCAVASVAFSASGAELTHRWSFNGDWSDSAGGAEAVKCGTYASLYGNRVHLGYNGAHGQGYINLGTNIIDTAAATIEIWARHDGVKKWSRVFDYGADDTHYFYVGWSFGTTLASERVEFYNSANGAKTYQDNTMGSNPNGYEIGRDYYIAITLQRQSESSTFMRWQRRDATTGELLGSGSMTAAIRSLIPSCISATRSTRRTMMLSRHTTKCACGAAFSRTRSSRQARRRGRTRRLQPTRGCRVSSRLNREGRSPLRPSGRRFRTADSV